jgi:two-component system chemotaxis sensor kinase CheA
MASDPYKYFRVEAHDLLVGLTQGVLELEKGAADRSAVVSLLRLAHTLKGASRVVKQPGIAELAHGVEGILEPYRDSERPIPKDRAEDVLGLLDLIGSHLAGLDQPRPEAAAPATRAGGDEPIKAVRIEVEELERLLGGLSEAAVALRRMESDRDALEQTRQIAGRLLQHLEAAAATGDSTIQRIRPLGDEVAASLESLCRRLGSGVDEARREILAAQDCANHLRLLPASLIFPHFVRAVRDAATVLGKQAQLETSGGDIRLDADVLVTMRDALLHLVRNAVAHGLETPLERTAAGKPPCGAVRIAIERRGNRVAFICRDDGGGIDVAAIRRAAVKRGVVTLPAAESLGLQDAIELVLQGGVSTTVTPTGISGRGIGLDVVRELAARVHGEISIQTEAGRGTAVEICAPVSLTSIPGLTVESDGIRASLPLDAVCETLRISESQIVRGASGDFIAYDGQTLPFVTLAAMLQRAAGPWRAQWYAVVVRSPKARMALGVDRLVGTATAVVRTLPEITAAGPVVAGASLDAEGNPQLVLDPAGLVSMTEEPPQAARNPAPPRRLVLVVDDSLTTRMVEQTILESAGYDVETASSGEEALLKAHARPHGLFLVDVEMPGMDGFEFVSRTRQDPVLRDTPAVLVTSRNSPEDRARGVQSGARAHIVKSEFEQGRFLETIRQLVTN